LLQQRIEEMSRTLDTKLGESRREMQDAVRHQFSESQRLIQGIQETLISNTREQTKTNEATTRFMTIAEQLANLEKTLKHQKQRGNLGEASLELILSNILPPGAYKMQQELGVDKDGKNSSSTQSSSLKKGLFRLMRSSHSITITA
jgi:DNA anti-recombination protein RmuC